MYQLMFQLRSRLRHWLLLGVAMAGTISAAAYAQTPSRQAQHGHPSLECAVMDCRAALAATDCCAALAVTNSVMASEVRPSLFAVRGDGLPRFARSDAMRRVQFKELLPQAQLLGQTLLSVWGFKIYEARLWAVPGFNAERFASQPLALELTYLRDFEAADIADRSIQEMRRSATIYDAQAQTWRREMQRVFPNVKAGDRILGMHRPGIGASFWVNGQPSGEILDAEFSNLFFGIWLSRKTSEPAMRAALLRGNTT